MCRLCHQSVASQRIQIDAKGNLPDESTILRFRHLLQTHNLSVQILAAVNATLGSPAYARQSGE